MSKNNSPHLLLLDQKQRAEDERERVEKAVQLWSRADKEREEVYGREKASLDPREKPVEPVRDDSILINLVDSMTRENGALSDSDLANILGVSRATINRIRHDKDFSYKPLRHRPLLNQRQIEKRLAFCRTHEENDWPETIFTDESRFATSPDCPVMWGVKKGDHIYVESEKFPTSFMVWGGIVGGRKTALLKCPNRLNAQGYVELLETNGIVDFIRQCGDNAVFQQDGARCHTDASTLLWLESKNIRTFDWPPNSPDLSPIEQIWGITKRFIIQRFGMKTPLTLEQLEAAVFEAYANIKPSTF